MADYNSKYTGSEIDSAIGKVLNNEVGGMILIPSAVLNLTPTSSSSDILSAFGGEEVFKSICQNVLNGITPYIGSVNSQQRQVDVIFTNFFAIIKDNSYTLSFSQLSYIGGNYNYDFRLQGRTVTFTKTLIAYGFANISYVSVNTININPSLSHQQILDHLGLDLNGVKELAFKANYNNLIIVSSGTNEIRTLIWDVKSSYTNDSNWTLNVSSSAPFEDDKNILVVRRFVIQCTNSTLSCTNNETVPYQRNRVRGVTSIGGVGFYNILRCPLDASENTCSGIVNFVQRTGNNSANFLTFYFYVNNNTLNVKALANTNPDALPSIAYTSNSNEGYLAIKINSTGEIRYDISISVEANCCLLSDNNILKSYSNLGNKSIVNF
jgi:hypothetical protein|uniref:Uncharacterized protein n=1 Tax=Siphoviridae sp. ct3r22 TaxID=2825325 RepID=A0A8S5V168_9CAUD|nr:MAG TPA: hypothetical protein [Siphoviridae sp. ct3r22]